MLKRMMMTHHQICNDSSKLHRQVFKRVVLDPTESYRCPSQPEPTAETIAALKHHKGTFLPDLTQALTPPDPQTTPDKPELQDPGDTEDAMDTDEGGIPTQVLVPTDDSGSQEVDGSTAMGASGTEEDVSQIASDTASVTVHNPTPVPTHTKGPWQLFSVCQHWMKIANTPGTFLTEDIPSTMTEAWTNSFHTWYNLSLIHI